MNFELSDTLTQLLEAKKLDKAIEFAEGELSKLPETDFHKILGKDLQHLKVDLKKYCADFDWIAKEILKRKQGFLKSIFGSKERVIPAAYYCEMNGFTINNDRWFIDLFSFEKCDPENWDWLSDFYHSSENDFTITGFEDIQLVYKDVHENNRFAEPYIEQAYDICELLVILRLQELFKKAYTDELAEWSKIPMFVTAHDYEMIYKVN